MTDAGLRRRRGYFVTVPRETIRDTALSYLARGVLSYLLDMPDGWIVKSEVLAAGSPDAAREGREVLRRALRELRTAGYYRLERRRLQTGRVVMGSSISDVADPAWARQSAAYYPHPVPVVEQRGGALLVIERDGTLTPDGFVAEDPAPDTTGAADDDDHGPDVHSLGIAAGQTGAQVAGPGLPGPGLPDSGAPGAGRGGPLRKTKTGDLEGVVSPAQPLTTRATPVPVDNSVVGRGERGSPRGGDRVVDLRDPRAPEVPHWRELDRVRGVPMPDGLRDRRRSRPATTDRRPGYTLATAVAYDGRDDAHRAAVAASLPDPAPVDPATAREARRAALAASLPSDRPTDDPTAPEDPRATS